MEEATEVTEVAEVAEEVEEPPTPKPKPRHRKKLEATVPPPVPKLDANFWENMLITKRNMDNEETWRRYSNLVVFK